MFLNSEIVEAKHFNQVYLNKIDYFSALYEKDKENFSEKIKIIKSSATGKVLEIGCGLGNATKHLTDLDLTSIDVSDWAVDYTKKYNNKTYQMSVNKMDFEDESFDTIIGFGILHHTELAKSLPEIKRVLKRGGKYVFFEPNLQFPESWLIQNLMRFISTNSPNEKYFTKEQIEKQIEGSSVEFWFSTHPKLPKFIFKLLPKTRYTARELFITGTK